MRHIGKVLHGHNTSRYGPQREIHEVMSVIIMCIKASTSCDCSFANIKWGLYYFSKLFLLLINIKPQINLFRHLHYLKDIKGE